VKDWSAGTSVEKEFNMKEGSCALWALGQFGEVDLGDTRLKKGSCIWRR
jgi:hypothetical protein